VLAAAAVVLITAIGRFAIGYWTLALLAMGGFPCSYLKDNKDNNTEKDK
jgi:hypothetical protein